MKKILCFLCAFILGLFSLFNLKSNFKSFVSASAYDNTYNYTAETLSDFNSMGNYSINSVESFSFHQELVFKVNITYTADYVSHFIVFSQDTYYSTEYISTYYAFSFNLFDNIGDYLNFGVVSLNNIPLMHIPSGNQTILAVHPNSVLDFYFSYGRITFNSDLSVDITPRINVVNNVVGLSDYSYLIDMNSDTNFTLTYDYFLQSQNPDVLFSQLIALSFGHELTQTFFYVNSSSGQLIAYTSSGQSINFRPSCTFYYLYFDIIITNVTSGTIINNNHGVNLLISLGEVNISVYRPVQRVNNTLVIYIYDFPQLISNINTTYYSLSRGSDLYTITYNGSLPNSYFVYVFNQDIQNTLFDEYIDVNFAFSDLVIPLDYDSNTGDYYTSFGFDFNFTYYSKPLVSSNSIYSYNFNKPGYVSMEFSLTPLYIPVLEAVENVFIFLLFYCPIISDILELLHLSEFVGSLLTVINYYTTGVLGTFITALISFLIFYLFFKSVMPSVSSGVGSMVDNSYIGYSSNRNKEEKYKKKTNRKELRHQYKLIDKEYKKRERNKKRGIPD